MPLRLPTYFPGVQADTKLYATVVSANATGYEVILGFESDCEGQNNCRYGTLIGTTLPLDQLEELQGRKRSVVTLERGIRGYYYDSVCHAYCSDSLVAWTEGRYHYVLGLKAERKPNVIRAANSAISTNTKE